MKELIEKYFLNSLKPVSIKDLITKLELQKEDITIIINSLYELEYEGKIIKLNNDDFIRVPKEFYLKQGIVKQSTKGNLYVNLDRGNIAIIPSKYEGEVEIGDMIYFEPLKNPKHEHLFYADIKRIVNRISICNNYLISGILKKDYSKGYYFISVNNYERIFIPNEYINGAFVGDEVTIRIIGEDNNFIGKVEQIIKRKRTGHLFFCKKLNKRVTLIPIGTNSIEIKKIPEGVEEGDYVLLDISDIKKPVFLSKVENNNEINIFAMEYGFETNFNPETEEEALNITNEISEEELDRRIDLRDLVTFTIDSESAKDLDDAVSLTKVNDNYVLYVSIADVSYYVKPGMKLFETACERTTSIYPANTVIPMLPKELSNGVCSLNPLEDKLTKTVKIIIDNNGEVIDFEIFNSVIKSDMKMSYQKVNDMLEEKEIHEEYLPFMDTLKDMNKLSKILQNRRFLRGFICFESEEYEYEFDENGNVINVILKERGPAQLLIENFMLIANEMVAKFINGLNVKGSFRNHEAPTLDQLRKLKENISDYDRYIHFLNNYDKPISLQRSLLSLFKNKSEEEKVYLSKIMLHSMNRAYYSTNNIGHYGLALEEYATFTSPIRRLPDLLNHLIIGYVLEGKYEYIEKLTKNFEKLSEHASEKQEDADILEKNIDFMLMNKYLLSLNGEELEAKVKFILKDFIYIKTNNGICGIIPLSKGSYNDGYCSINKTHINVGDDIYVTFEYIQDYMDSIVFTYKRKKNNKKLERNKKNG